MHLFSPIETGSYNLEHRYPNSKARYRDAEVEQFEIDFSEIFPFIAANQYSIESLLLMIEYEKHYKKVFGRKENQHVDIHFDALDPNHFLEKILNEKKYAKQSEYTTILARFGLRALPLWEQLFHATNNPQLLYSAVSQIAKLNQNAEQFFLDQLNLEDPIKRSYATFGLYLIREKLKDPKLEEKLLAEIKKNVERSSRYAIMLLNETSRLRPEIEQVVIERQKSLPGGWSGYFQNVALKKVIRSYLHNYSNNYIAPIEIKIMRSNSIQSVATPITVAALLTNDIENEIDNFVRQDIQFQTGAISDLSNERMRLTKELDSLIQGLDSLAIIRLNRQLDEVSSRQSRLISASIKHALNDLESPKAFNNAFTLIDTVFHSIDTSSPTSSALNLMRTSLNQLAEKDPEQFRQQSYTYLRQYYRQKGLSEENEIEAAVRSLKIEASASFTFAAALKRVLERLYQRGLLKSDE